jgi:hypothetical protein
MKWPNVTDYHPINDRIPFLSSKCCWGMVRARQRVATIKEHIELKHIDNAPICLIALVVVDTHSASNVASCWSCTNTTIHRGIPSVPFWSTLLLLPSLRLPLKVSSNWRNNPSCNLVNQRVTNIWLQFFLFETVEAREIWARKKRQKRLDERLINKKKTS